MIYYVDGSAFKAGCGTKEHPFKTIQAAADLAEPGDEVLVAPGLYREAVNPKRGGTADARITYRSTEPLGAHITGAESVKGWKNTEGNVWTVSIPNGLFGDFNPYTNLVFGDWYMAQAPAHLGDVFLNEKSMYEVTDLEGVRNPVVSVKSWDRAFSVYTWYTEQDAEKDETVFWANFQGHDPNTENVEITVRKNCFYPEAEGNGYITLSGFKVSQAGPQWAPPTAYQEGMIGPHWSKGWIIEDCEVYEAKCSGISLGKYLQPNNDNKWSKWGYKDGTQTERDCICQASYEGWDKEHVGSHIVRRCNIHDCGQTGIVGHLGGVFSIIEDNHIHHINNKQNLSGAEIGGIKMHASIDVVIRRNCIHNCIRGVWLDWQAQGTRVTQNLFFNNTLPGIDTDTEASMDLLMAVGEDIFVEVSHGPTLMDNNVFLSPRSVKLACQGVALVHNIVAGAICAVGCGTGPRYTPYHKPHGTQVAGFMTFLHGDVRFYNNIFVQQDPEDMPVLKLLEKMQPNGDFDDWNTVSGISKYDEYPTFDEWNKIFEGPRGMGAGRDDRFFRRLPVWTGGNVYLNGAKPYAKEQNFVVDDTHSVKLEAEEKDGSFSLRTNLYSVLPNISCGTISTATLGMAFEPEERFENPDGSPITFNKDFFGCSRSIAPMPGAFEDAEAVETLKKDGSLKLFTQAV